MTSPRIDLSSAPSLMERRAAAWAGKPAMTPLRPRKPSEQFPTPKINAPKAPAPKVKRGVYQDNNHRRSAIEISHAEQDRIRVEALTAFAPPTPSPGTMAGYLTAELTLDLMKAQRCTNREFAGIWELQADADMPALRSLGLAYFGEERHVSLFGAEVRKFLLEEIVRG